MIETLIFNTINIKTLLFLLLFFKWHLTHIYSTDAHVAPSQSIYMNYMNKIPFFFYFKYLSNRKQTSVVCEAWVQCETRQPCFHILQLWSKSNPKQQKAWNVWSLWFVTGTKHLSLSLFCGVTVFQCLHSFIHPSSPSDWEMPCVSAGELSFSFSICCPVENRASLSGGGGQKFGFVYEHSDLSLYLVLIRLSLRRLDSEWWGLVNIVMDRWNIGDYCNTTHFFHSKSERELPNALLSSKLLN